MVSAQKRSGNVAIMQLPKVLFDWLALSPWRKHFRKGDRSLAFLRAQQPQLFAQRQYTVSDISREKSCWFLIFKSSFLPSSLFGFFHIASVVFKELSLVPEAVNESRWISE